MFRSFSICFFLALSYFSGAAQQEKKWIKHQITALSAPSMHGRGYVSKGLEKASQYIQRQFHEYGLVSVNNDTDYAQLYSFPVNTFPGALYLKINKTELVPGSDYIIDAASTSFSAEKIKIRKSDLEDADDSEVWQKLRDKWRAKPALYILENTDSFCKATGTSMHDFLKQLPRGCYIVTKQGKMNWGVATDTTKATVFYVEDSILPRRPKTAAVEVKSLFQRREKCENIIGMVPGTVKDSYIVFTAHYDHLGMMGKHAEFPGASDNASGTAMMLYLAHYYAAHPQHYTMVFIAFSGEEPGLLGSHYFVEHPLIPLNQIRFLTNIDIMGDASDGITVVNATEFPTEFGWLQQLSNKEFLLPQVKSRGKAAISDHYFFTEAGVPSFFLYSNGGPGYYHDIFDNAKSLSLDHIDDVATLLMKFTDKLNGR
jgi:aminopeptidase YwaD